MYNSLPPFSVELANNGFWQTVCNPVGGTPCP
jgi:hypothetical protein